MLSSNYLTKQLIAYIGNKRTLLGFLSKVFDELDLGDNVTFSDPFAGTGAVSRLGKLKGFKVYSNDWEYYSFIVNSCFLNIDKSEITNLFKKYGGIEQVFEDFKNLDNDFSPYISRYYAPENTENADYFKERLFYTKENAIFIDRARTKIETMYSGDNLTETEKKEKSILLGSLLYEVSTHANTSGVFKACHKGFGGHGKDALGRIMTSMVMEIPNLIDSSSKCVVSKLDAIDFVKGVSTDICYLDPPYNTHQYGSNYFMLNSVAKWDRPAVNQNRGVDGRFVEKAGIRKDWKQTKSPFCYKKQAPEAFRELIRNIDSRYIILSYNTEGIIPFDQLFDIMETHGKVSLHIKDYVLYRGGKQGLTRKKPDELRTIVLHPKLTALKVFVGYQFIDHPQDLNLLSLNELELLSNELLIAQCRDNLEECTVLISLLESERDKKTIKKLQKRFMIVYKKLAFKKYIDIFNRITNIINVKIDKREENFVELNQGVNDIQSIAELRFKG
ncbi:MAG: hypothetical protein B6229_10015 [Spirochaetaceae bacterium 4572_7]|nr:MAG: hypothetical protein B6229_10015 [Spirochaetaceae bacterium 4572_7]